MYARFLVSVNLTALFSTFLVTEALEDEIEKMKLANVCKVCLTENSDRVFQPCGHLACCNGCAERLRLCPICRNPIKELVKVVIRKRRKKTVANFIDFDLFLEKHKYFGIRETDKDNKR